MSEEEGELLPHENEEEEIIEDNVGPSLSRQLGIIDGAAIIFGIMIGAGIFASPGSVLTSANNSIGLSLIVWGFAGILCLIGGLCFAELGSTFPSSGGSYQYLVMGWHPVLGFLFTWACILCLRTGGMAIVSIVFAQYLGSVILSEEKESILAYDYKIKIIAITAIFLISAFNLLSVKWSARLQKVLSIFKFLAFGLVFIFAFMGLLISDTRNIAKENFNHAFSDTDDPWSFKTVFTSTGASLIYALWAYEGFANLNAVAEEVKNPGKNIPAAIIIAVLSVTITYVAINISYLCVLPASTIATSGTVAVDMAEAVAGTPGKILMPLLVALCGLGSLNGVILTSSRIFYASARNGHFPFSSFVSRLSRFGVPYVAVILQGSIAIILVIPGSFETLVSYFGFTAWIFYVFVVSSLIRMRFTKKDVERPFRVRPFPIIPIIFIIVSLYIVFASFLGSPGPSFLALLVLLTGVPVFYLFFWKGNAFVKLYEKIVTKKTIEKNISNENVSLDK